MPKTMMLVLLVLALIAVCVLAARKESYLALGRFTSPPAPQQLRPGYTGSYTGAVVPESKTGPLTWTGLPFLWTRV